MSRDYLTTQDVLALHHVLLQRYGGSAGLRDAGALEAALFRPQSGHYEDIIWEAAALFESQAQNHPFVDGNKRVAFAAVDVFLRINGYRIAQTSQSIYDTMIKMIEMRTFDIAHIEPWLRGMAEKR